MSEKELRELDAWIAEHVMGWRMVETSSENSPLIAAFCNEHKNFTSWKTVDGFIELPKFTTDPAAAFQVLEKCVNELCEQDQEETVSVGMEVPYFVVEKTNNSKSMRVEAPTLPLAICLFAKQLFSK